jgi:hypothetical protein
VAPRHGAPSKASDGSAAAKELLARSRSKQQQQAQASQPHSHAGHQTFDQQPAGLQFFQEHNTQPHHTHPQLRSSDGRMLNNNGKVTNREEASAEDSLPVDWGRGGVRGGQGAPAIGVERFQRDTWLSHVQADALVSSLQNLHSEPLLNQPQLGCSLARSASKGQPRLGRIAEAEEEAVLAGNTVTNTSAPSTESPRYSWRGPGEGGGGGAVPGGGSNSPKRLSSLVKSAQQRLSQHSKPTTNIAPSVAEHAGKTRQKLFQNLEAPSPENLQVRAVDISGDGQSKANASSEQEKAERAAQRRAQFVRQPGIEERNTDTGDQDLGGSGGNAQQDDGAKREGWVGVGGEGSGVLELIEELLKDERRSGDEKEGELHGPGEGRGGCDEGRGGKVPVSPEVPPRKKEKKKTSVVSSPGVGGVAKMMQVDASYVR